MNSPFDTENNNIFPKELKVQVLLQTMGRKKITFLTGWNINNEELKDHMKNIKKKNGCNGTIKTLEDNKTEIQFQGDLVDFLKDYLVKSGIEPNNIIIKGA